MQFLHLGECTILSLQNEMKCREGIDAKLCFVLVSFEVVVGKPLESTVGVCKILEAHFDDDKRYLIILRENLFRDCRVTTCEGE